MNVSLTNIPLCYRNKNGSLIHQIKEPSSLFIRQRDSFKGRTKLYHQTNIIKLQLLLRFNSSCFSSALTSNFRGHFVTVFFSHIPPLNCRTALGNQDTVREYLGKLISWGLLGSEVSPFEQPTIRNPPGCMWASRGPCSFCFSPDGSKTFQLSSNKVIQWR